MAASHEKRLRNSLLIPVPRIRLQKRCLGGSGKVPGNLDLKMLLKCLDLRTLAPAQESLSVSFDNVSIDKNKTPKQSRCAVHLLTFPLRIRPQSTGFQSGRHFLRGTSAGTGISRKGQWRVLVSLVRISDWRMMWMWQVCGLAGHQDASGQGCFCQSLNTMGRYERFGGLGTEWMSRVLANGSVGGWFLVAWPELFL